tara:strand:+ start:66 stop:374 length:309 start_codon:yes stop_codon:yes gene_type:complete
MSKIKKEDIVKVISGSYRGQTGRVLKILTKNNRALVEGINKAKKHMRPTQENPQGGIVEKELSIHLSNLALIYKGEAVKVGYKLTDDGKKNRINKSDGNVID